MARMRETLTALGTHMRTDTVVPVHVLVERRRQRAEHLKQVRATIIAEAREAPP